eukprot:1161645-Pelagomonas_calceolata.AAC.31
MKSHTQYANMHPKKTHPELLAKEGKKKRLRKPKRLRAHRRGPLTSKLSVGITKHAIHDEVHDPNSHEAQVANQEEEGVQALQCLHLILHVRKEEQLGHVKAEQCLHSILHSIGKKSNRSNNAMAQHVMEECFSVQVMQCLHSILHSIGKRSNWSNHA